MSINQFRPVRRLLVATLTTGLVAMSMVVWAPAGGASQLPFSASAAAAPSQPTNVVVTANGKRELTATWQAPAALNGAEVTGYTVTFKEVYTPGPKVVTVTLDASAALEATGTGLATWANEVTVVAHSSAGDSPASTPVQESAYDDPFFGELNEHFGAITIDNTNDLWVSWSEANGNGSPIDHYEIWSNLNTTAPLATFPYSSGGRIYNVPAGKLMTLSVVAVTTRGLRAMLRLTRDVMFPAPPAPTPTSTPSVVTTPAQVPARPTRLQAKVLGSKAVLTWAGPASSAKATRYIVLLKKPNGKKSVTRVRMPITVLRKLATGRYKVSVMAGNDAGWSKASSQITFRVGA